MHGHLKGCVLDYGPIHNFWCFSFERYNGILENYPTNTSLEIHCMNRFLREPFVSSASLPVEYKDDFNPILVSLDPVLQGSLRATVLDHDVHVEPIQPELVSDWTIGNYICPPPKYVRSAFYQDDISQVESLYSFLYSSMSSSQFMLNTIVNKYSRIEYRGSRLKGLSQENQILFILCSNTVHTTHKPWDQLLFTIFCKAFILLQH